MTARRSAAWHRRRRRTPALAAGLAAGLGAAEAVAAPTAAVAVTGIWRTEPRSDGSFADVRIGPCPGLAGEVCGTIVAVGGGAPATTVGFPLIRRMRADGPGQWRGGRIVHPVEGTVYRAKLDLREDGLRVRGCVLWGLLCGGQTWTRVQ